MGVLFSEGGGEYFQILIFGWYVLMVGKGMLSEIVCKKFHSSFFRFARSSWIVFVRNNPLVRPSATKIWINCTAQYWCFTPYKPYIFWKLVTPTFHWPTVHSPIAHSDPPHPQNPPTWLFIHLMMFNTIQTKYFMKPYVTHYPQNPPRIHQHDYLSTWWRLTLYKPNILWNLMSPTIYWPTADSPFTHTDSLKVVMHCRFQCTGDGDALQVLIHCKWSCT